jgi:hypothetical protein
MAKVADQLANLRVAAPCEVSWDGMAGDERVRHCSLCSLNVYNFSEMTPGEARELLLRTEGRICGRLYRRADGTLLTRDCPTGLRALRRRASRAAAALVAALFSLPAFALGGRSCEKPRLKTHGSKIKFEIERIATPQPARFNGVVHIQSGSQLPGVTVKVQDEVTKREVTAITDVNGAFSIASLNDGIYRVEVTLAGFQPTTIEHLELKSSQVTHADIGLQFDARVEMGIIVMTPDPVTSSDGISTTFTQDFINKLPL